VLRKEEWDVNHDGRIDIKKIYDAKGILETEVMDYDFDGYFDVVNHYRAGKLYMKELSLEFKGNFNVWKYYEDGG